MSMTSPRDQAAGDLAQTQAQLNRTLANESFPMLQQTLARITAQLQNGGDQATNAAFANAQRDLDAGYAQQSRSSAELFRQQAKQSGMEFDPAQIQATIGQNQRNLDTSQFIASKELEYQKAGAGLQNYNYLMNLLGTGGNQMVGLGQGFVGNQMNAIAGMNSMSPGQGALGGMATGAGIGTQIYPGWGTVIGAAVGAGAGYLGAG